MEAWIIPFIIPSPGHSCQVYAACITVLLLYRVSQDERSIFWEVIVSVMLNKRVYMYMCPIPNGFRDRDISLYVHCTVEQHAISSHELQSALILTVEFSKTYCDM
jgi:hypothetical protein